MENVLTSSLLLRHSLVENNNWFWFLIRIETLVFKVHCLFELRNGLVEVVAADAFGVDGFSLPSGFQVRVVRLVPRLLGRGALFLRLLG